VNPYAAQLTFTAKHTRTRRDHEKYLTLIDAIALLHQHQRERLKDEEGGEYLEVILQDIELANRIAPELLGRSLDELPPQSRRILGIIKELVRERCEAEELDPQTALFSRREVSTRSGWSYSQVRRHLARLQELDYILPRYGRMGCRVQYELLVDPANDDPGEAVTLLNVDKLISTTTTLTPKQPTLTPPCQNEMTRLSRSEEGTKENLATLPDRTSGTRSEKHRTVAVGE